jgi:DNA-binding NarL/FixJ family response regulator
MRLFIADDSAALRSRLKEALSEFKDIEIVGQAGYANDALESIRKLTPDVAILDIRFTNGSGIDVLETVKKEGIPTKVIIFTNFPYLQYRKRCFDAGADFFFYKAIEFEKLIATIEKLIPHFRQAEKTQ